MQAKQLQKTLSRVAIATTFALFAIAPLNTVHANEQKLESIQNTAQDMLEFLDKNSTSPTHFETKTIKLGYKDDEQELFSKEMYRKRRKKRVRPVVEEAKQIVAEGKTAPEDKSLTITKGDSVLTFGGATKMEHYFQRNASYLNRNLPDENEYFKNTFDFSVDLSYGEKRFGHKAVEAYLDILHKGVWGKNGLVADSEPSVPTAIRVDETILGDHTHQNGRPFIWIRDGWLRFSLNAVANSTSDCVHYLKLGWFPFDLGRGIALGSAFGLNRSALGVYSYPEEKSAPGINLSGELVKNTVSYDLYWARFEERNKDLRSTTEILRKTYTPQPQYLWRGLGKDNDVLAARLKIKPFKTSYSEMEVEPYVMYNTAPDQKLDIRADSDTKLGAVGLAVEHSYKNFEWGGEVAGNFGKTTVFAIDKNVTEIYRDANGKLGERWTLVGQYDPATGGVLAANSKVDRSAAIDAVVKNQLTYQNPNTPAAVPGYPYQIISSPDRFRKGYENKFGGWMGVVDAAYNFKEQNVKLAAGAGYASGDKDPDMTQESKTYKGFVGLNEIYSGKRVRSILVLDERKLQRPVIYTVDPTTKKINDAAADISFSDLAFGGGSVSWTPHLLGKKCQFNPNGVLFWKAFQENKPIVDPASGDATLTEAKASKFMGTELNLLTRVELLRDFNMFANFAVFVPGQFFKDFSGLQIEGKEFEKGVLVVDDAIPLDKTLYRLASNPAFHVNVGLTYKF